MNPLKELYARLAARPRLAAALAAAALAAVAAALYLHYAPFLAVDDVWFLGEAESFYHGVALQGGLDSMPLNGHYHSLLAHNLPAGWERPFLPFAILSLLAAAYSLGAALGGARCGALSAGLAGLLFLSPGGLANWGRYFETAVFTLITALAAVFLVRYRATGRTGHAVMLGLLAGASLLCRSTFFLFPPFILAALWAGRGEKKIKPAAAAAILLLPYAMLVPWWLLRHSLGLEFALFETFRAKANIITGLLGRVHTIEGSYQEALALAGLNGSESLWRWGLGQAAAHPLTLAKAVLLRAWAVLAYKPAATLLAAAAFFLGRKDAGARALWAFVFYFILVHLPMPVEPRYFVPLLIPLAALGARAAGARFWPADAPAAAGWPARALAALVLAGPAAVYAGLGHYADGVKTSDQAAVIAAEAAAHPRCAWLAGRAGEEGFGTRHREALALQNAGRHAESLRLLESLLAERPGSAALWSDKGMQELRLGRKEQARASFRKAVQLDPGFIPAYLNLLYITPDKAAAGKLRAAALANLKPPYEGLRAALASK